MPPPWTDPRWKAEAERWIREHAEVVGEIEQPHVRPWSTVMRVPTAAGDLWFKAVSPLHRFEPALTALLAELQPDRVPEVVALDRNRAWMLLRDGGTRLRDAPATVEHWERALPVYAELQIAATPRAAELLELGVPDFRLANLRDLLEDLLSEQPAGLSSDDYRAMLDRLPEAESMADGLLAHGIPETIQHDDLHDGQVFVRDGRHWVVDWGDACVSHPFFVLAVALEGQIAWGLDDVEDSVDTAPFRDTFLAPYEAAYPNLSHADLVEAARLATRLGWAARSVNGHLPVDEQSTLRRLEMFVDGRVQD
jgi:hypothetical protein